MAGAEVLIVIERVLERKLAEEPLLIPSAGGEHAAQLPLSSSLLGVALWSHFGACRAVVQGFP